MDISLLILTNRGHLKCYRTVEHFNQQLNLELADEVNFLDAHRRLADHDTDDAGRYHDSPRVPNNGNVNTSSYNEKNNLDLEIERRLDREISERIEGLLGKNPPPWALVAPEPMLARLKNVLKVSILTQCVAQVPKDLVNAPIEEVREHVKAAVVTT